MAPRAAESNGGKDLTTPKAGTDRLGNGIAIEVPFMISVDFAGRVHEIMNSWCWEDGS
jgi:hypothetical protein